MDINTNKEAILQAIDQMRFRKARPDAKNICSFVRRKHGIEEKKCERLLEGLVKSNEVIKVQYKGYASYRNPAKWARVGGNQQEDRNISADQVRQLLKNAFEVIIAQDLRFRSKRAIPKRVLENYFKVRYFNFDKSQLDIALQREMNAGNISKSELDLYIYEGKKFQEGADDAKNRKLANGDSTNKPVDNSLISNRAKRHKKTRKVFDPSDVSPPKKRGRPPGSRNKPKATTSDEDRSPTPPPAKRVAVGANSSYVIPVAALKGTPTPPVRRPGRPVGSGTKQSLPSSSIVEVTCDQCGCTAVANKHGDPEGLLICKDCKLKVHPSCLDYSEELAARSLMSPWQCMDCKMCIVCNSFVEETLLVCDACDKGYHISCHKPVIKEKPQGKWICQKCKLEDSSYNGGGYDPEPPDELSFDPDIPDASNWSPQQVQKFFLDNGFPEEFCMTFEVQEIDGKSLLMMERSDVLTSLNIKLGPALKMYRYIKELQTRQKCDMIPWLKH